jgi:signal transduction histidine kinase
VKPTEFHLVDVFAALRGIFRPLQGQHTAELIFDDPDDLPPLYTDEGKLSQILRNFISNAMKFTKDGHVLVRAERRDPLVVVSVEDTGVGIAPEDQRRLFLEFSQLEDESETRHKGTGLGLSLSKRLAELIGGTVSVTSTRGKGSTFYVAVPMRYAPSDAAREAQHA